MFDTFKRPKRINAVIGTVKPLIALYCCDEEGKPLEEIFDDEYVIAYFYAMISFNLMLLGKLSATESGMILMGAFDALFKEKGHTILEYCNRSVANKDEEFITTVMEAMAELDNMHKSIMNGKSVDKTELSIQGYLIDVYN